MGEISLTLTHFSLALATCVLCLRKEPPLLLGSSGLGATPAGEPQGENRGEERDDGQA
jgi:hypothetical protein